MGWNPLGSTLRAAIRDPGPRRRNHLCQSTRDCAVFLGAVTLLLCSPVFANLFNEG